MGYYVLHDEDKGMKDWLKASIISKCTACGAPMMNYYNDELRCTNRRCSNEDCCGMKAARADFMCKVLNIRDIGYATCLQWTRNMEGQSHVQILQYFSKQTMPLYTYLRIHCFEGIDSAWENICKTLNVYSLDELFDTYVGDYRPLLDENIDLLYDNLQYVDLTERPETHVNAPVRYYNIMVTGTPIGFASKEDFFEQCNNAMMGKIILLHQKTKRQTDVDYLIREPGSTTRGKVEAAIKGGIPIVTSQELIQILIKELEEITEGEDDNEE